MPCHPYYPELTPLENQLNTIFIINEELAGQQKPNWYSHPLLQEKEYTQSDLEAHTLALCQKLQDLKEVTGYSITLQKWWLDHRIHDYRNLVKEVHQKTDPKSNYEQYLLKHFLLEMMADAFLKIEMQMEEVKYQPKEKWPANFPQLNFVRTMSSFELFCELRFLQIDPYLPPANLTFRTLEGSERKWKEVVYSAYADWLNQEQYTLLKRYFVQYQSLYPPPRKAGHIFELRTMSAARGTNPPFTIGENRMAIWILRLLVEEICAI